MTTIAEAVGAREELLCATALGFCYLLRVGELESLRMSDIRLDREGDTVLTIYIRPSKTDR